MSDSVEEFKESLEARVEKQAAEAKSQTMKLVVDQLEKKLGAGSAAQIQALLPPGFMQGFMPQTMAAAPIPGFAQAYTQAPVAYGAPAPVYAQAQPAVYAP